MADVGPKEDPQETIKSGDVEGRQTVWTLSHEDDGRHCSVYLIAADWKEAWAVAQSYINKMGRWPGSVELREDPVSIINMP